MSVLFTGAGQEVNFGNDPLLDAVQPMTLLAWLRASSLGTNRYIFSKDSSKPFARVNDSSGNIRVDWGHTGVDLSVVTTTGPIVAGTHHFVSVMINGTNVQIAVGDTRTPPTIINANTTLPTGTLQSNATRDFIVGNRRDNGGDRPWLGDIYWCAYYAKAMTITEIRSMWHRLHMHDKANCLIWAFLGLRDLSPPIDQSGNGFDGTLTGVQRSAPFPLRPQFGYDIPVQQAAVAPSEPGFTIDTFNVAVTIPDATFGSPPSPGFLVPAFNVPVVIPQAEFGVEPGFTVDTFNVPVTIPDATFGNPQTPGFTVGSFGVPVGFSSVEFGNAADGFTVDTFNVPVAIPAASFGNSPTPGFTVGAFNVAVGIPAVTFGEVSVTSATEALFVEAFESVASAHGRTKTIQTNEDSDTPIRMRIKFMDASATEDEALATPTRIASIHFSVWRQSNNEKTIDNVAINPADAMLTPLRTVGWTQDYTGYNFFHILPRIAIPEGDTYDLEYKFVSAGGAELIEPIVVNARAVRTS